MSKNLLIQIILHNHIKKLKQILKLFTNNDNINNNYNVIYYDKKFKQ